MLFLQWFKIQAKRINLNLQEVSGGFGDMPVFLIFLVALVSMNHLDPAPALVFAGLFNIINGVAFGIPMSLEPMKAIGILAISTHLSPSGIYTTGIIMGIVMLILSFTGLLRSMVGWIPKVVVRGIQLGLGIIFIKQGYALMVKGNTWFGINGYLIAIIACLFIFWFSDRKIIPIALSIFFAGILIVFVINYSVIRTVSTQIYVPKTTALDFTRWRTIINIVASQLVLTIANSVVATTMLVRDYFPEKAYKNTTTRIGYSLGIVNIISSPFGGMPMCHGAGGIAAQYKFGARTGTSIIFMGCLKIIAGLFLSTYVITIARLFPTVLLGSMLLFSGIELSTHIKDVKDRKDIFIMITTAALAVVSNMVVACLSGLTMFYVGMMSRNREEVGIK